MKKLKVANMKSDMARTPPDAMAPLPSPEPTEEDKLRKGGYDMDHLMGAEDIKSDPERMKYVQKAHAKKTVQMRSIADLKMAGQALAQQQKEEMNEPKLDARANAKEEAAEGGAPAQPRHKTRYPKK